VFAPVGVPLVASGITAEVLDGGVDVGAARHGGTLPDGRAGGLNR
jgi:hypothetical protein